MLLKAEGGGEGEVASFVHQFMAQSIFPHI